MEKKFIIPMDQVTLTSYLLLLIDNISKSVAFILPLFLPEVIIILLFLDPLIDGVRINSPHYLCKIQVDDKMSRKLTLVVSQYEKSTTIYYTVR